MVRGSTALLDAIGKTVTSFDRKVNKGMFIINTDGLENASREFSRGQIKDMVENSGFEFIFIGADIDSYAEASKIGINRSHVANYSKTSQGIGDLYDSVDQLATMFCKEQKLGLVKNNIAELISYCKKNNIEEKDIINTGVIKNKHTASSFDDDKYLFFRNRIMIPIHNTNGKIVAFGGRIYKNDDKTAKYLNSSENDFFKKGQILFNLHRAKMNLNKDNSLIVVEGYMDTITLWQNAFKTAIAPLGTSITETHLKTIINFCKTPIFIFDSDIAGQKAAIRCCEMLFPILQTGIIPKFLTLQSAKDCDEFLNKFSKESLKRQIDNAIEINEFLFQQKIKKYNVKNPNQKAQFQK